MTTPQTLPYTKTFSATGASDAFKLSETRNPITIEITTGTVKIERSVDEGATWTAVQKPDFTDAEFTADAAFDMAGGNANEWFRFNCTAYTSGVVCRAG